MVDSRIKSDIIGDWVSPRGHRYTVAEWSFPRYILPEVNTYRQFSRSAQSSRAIPIAKRIDAVRDNPWVPVHWGLNQPGMVAEEELDVQTQIEAESVWRESAQAAADYATYLAKLKLHKQIATRILEPYLIHLHVVAATDWENMFKQRIHPDAQPEFQILAQSHLDAMTASVPRELDYGEWATPYIREDEEYMDVEVLKKLSVSRVAKSSYGNAGKADIEKDLELYERLYWANPIHAAPFEMIATPTKEDDILGNFTGWKQLRHVVELERSQREHEGLPDI